jgi:hypothetical protein
VRPFVAASERIFVENQCEKPFLVSIEPDNVQIMIGQEENLVEALTSYFSERGSFIAELIRADLETLPFLADIAQKNHD